METKTLFVPDAGCTGLMLPMQPAEGSDRQITFALMLNESATPNTCSLAVRFAGEQTPFAGAELSSKSLGALSAFVAGSLDEFGIRLPRQPGVAQRFVVMFTRLGEAIAIALKDEEEKRLLACCVLPVEAREVMGFIAEKSR